MKELIWFESKMGKIFTIPYFLSTAKEDYDNSDLVWQISTHHTNSQGRDISNLSNNKYELEVLFDKGVKFKIKYLDRSKNYIYLEEVDSSSVSDFDLVGLYTLNL